MPVSNLANVPNNNWFRTKWCRLTEMKPRPEMWVDVDIVGWEVLVGVWRWEEGVPRLRRVLVVVGVRRRAREVPPPVRSSSPSRPSPVPPAPRSTASRLNARAPAPTVHHDAI